MITRLRIVSFCFGLKLVLKTVFVGPGTGTILISVSVGPGTIFVTITVFVGPGFEVNIVLVGLGLGFVDGTGGVGKTLGTGGGAGVGIGNVIAEGITGPIGTGGIGSGTTMSALLDIPKNRTRATASNPITMYRSPVTTLSVSHSEPCVKRQ